jgi:hypothetical protein
MWESNLLPRILSFDWLKTPRNIKQQTGARATHSGRVIKLSQNRRVKFSSLTILFCFSHWKQVNINPDLYFFRFEAILNFKMLKIIVFINHLMMMLEVE